jgi:Holliday junction resolvase-like predicted endonuclease
LAVGPNKQRRLRRLAALWLASNHVTTRSVRFDVVSVVNDDVEVIEGAF